MESVEAAACEANKIHNIDDGADGWSEVSVALRGAVGEDAFQRWFGAAVWKGVSDAVGTLAVPGEIHQVWIETNYLPELRAAVCEAFDGVREVAVVVNDAKAPAAANGGSVSAVRAGHAPTLEGEALERRIKGSGLNPAYTFGSFVVGSNSQFAHAACEAVAKKAGIGYNPLFIYGGVGLGKTHLLQATGNAILRTMPHAVVLYTTSEDFTNQVIEAIQHSKMEQFRRRYREVDVLIIDDIQFLANKERTQEELFHTFNSLTEERKQIVISSDRPPKELTIMQDRLVSRFERGMVADVTMPDYETRYAILAEKAQEYGLLLEDKVLRYVAEHATKSIRQLEGILMQAVAQYELEHCVPTVRSMTDIMNKLCDSSDEKKEDVGFVKEPEKAIAFQDVLETVSRYFSVSIPDMLGDSRVREILIPRQIAMYIGKKHVRMSFVRLGATFSNRDHTTVMNAVEKIETKMKEDGQLLREVRTIEMEVGITA